MKIYTRKGDQGTTQLIGGRRVTKSHLRIEAYGTVDELNSWIGYLKDTMSDSDNQEILTEIQDRLFTIGSILASDPKTAKMKIPSLEKSDVVWLENLIDKMEAEIPPLKSFILPGGNKSSSICQIARCVCRRCERLVVALSDQEKTDLLLVMYLNRLSDFLFVLARHILIKAGIAEIQWKPRL